MSLSLDKAFGLLPAAVDLQSKRLELLSSNLANTDTPYYKARDFDFHAHLAEAQGPRSELPLSKTSIRHLPVAQGRDGGSPELQYRIPSQPSLDGNTVDPHLERTAFAENSVYYQSTLEFLDRRVSGLRAALRSE